MKNYRIDITLDWRFVSKMGSLREAAQGLKGHTSNNRLFPRQIGCVDVDQGVSEVFCTGPPR